MRQILEYVIQHYTLFLGGAILILLAIIGYYADKTNFGQGKSSENKEKDENLKNIENVGLLDITNPENNNNVVTEEVQSDSDVLENLELPVGDESKNIDLKDNLDIVDPVVIDSEQNVELTENLDNIQENSKTGILLSENEFDKFNDEFNLIVPEKETISADLLSDIDDMELGKTQKLELSDVPDLDDIELPRIKQFTKEEQDIWKF